MLVVTGATGFLGSHMVCALLEKGLRVKAIKRPASDLSLFRYVLKLHAGPSAEAWEENLEWADADLNDILALDEVLEGAEKVFHCAALVSFNADREELFRINAEGTANLVNACLKTGVKKLIYASSTAALGRTDSELPITEDTPWTDDPNNTVYAQSKHMAELEVWRGVEEGLNAVIVNPGIILGSGDWNKGSCKLFDRVAKGLAFYTDGVNGYVGVRDVVNIMYGLSVSDISAERYLLISENLSYGELFSLMAKELRVRAPHIRIRPSWGRLLYPLFRIRTALFPRSGVTHENLRTSLKKHRYDASKIRRLGYTFTPVAEVIRQTATDYRAGK